MKRKVLALLLVVVLAVALVGCADNLEVTKTGDYLAQGENTEKTTDVSSDEIEKDNQTSSQPAVSSQSVTQSDVNGESNSSLAAETSSQEQSSQSTNSKVGQSDISSSDTSSLTSQSETSSNVTTSTQTVTQLTKQEAKKIALDTFGVKESEIFDYEIQLDTEKGKKVYEISFEISEFEFDITIDAISGIVIKQEKEPQENTSRQSANQSDQEITDTKETLISKQKAKEIVLADAGVTNVFDYEIELDKEKGVSYYEIEFKSGNVEYDYKLNAKTGEIVTKSKEEKGAKSEQQDTASSSTEEATFISKQKAKEIALTDAGVTNVFDYEIELDKEKGVSYYEIEFKSGDYEYKYLINAQTGVISEREKEKDK